MGVTVAGGVGAGAKAVDAAVGGSPPRSDGALLRRILDQRLMMWVGYVETRQLLSAMLHRINENATLSLLLRDMTFPF